MNPNRRWLPSFVAMLLAVAPAFAGGGAWNRDEGGYYVKIGLSSLTANDEFGYDGSFRPIFADTANFADGEFGVTDIALYGELGLTDWLTGVASTQYKVAVRQAHNRRTGRDSTASASGLGDLWLGARVRLAPRSQPFVASLTVSWKVPTGSPLQQIPLGTGVADYEAALAVGTGFPLINDLRGYAQISGGYRLRNSASNELNYLAEVGVNLSEVLMVQMMMDGTASSADFSSSATEAGVPLANKAFVSDQSFTRWQIGAVYATSETMEINLGYGWTQSGRNALASGGISVGVAWKK